MRREIPQQRKKADSRPMRISLKHSSRFMDRRAGKTVSLRLPAGAGIGSADIMTNQTG